MNKKTDPIRDNFFVPLEMAETWLTLLFYVTAFISVLVLFIGKAESPGTYSFVQIAFVVLVISAFVLGLAVRFYWGPRAAEQRNADFASTAFAVNLTTERTHGYYNNTEVDPIRKTAFQLLENTFFTKEIARLMCARRRTVVGSYVVVWVAVFANRSTPIDVVAVACQVLFSEGIISSVIRLEWLRGKTERIFVSVFRHMQVSSSETPAHIASVIENLVAYETVKATSGVTLDGATFENNNARLSAEWDRISATLRLPTSGGVDLIRQ